MKRISLLVVVALTLTAAVAPTPAPATIHEIVASFCSGQNVQDPGGQSDPAKNSFLRALTATGVFQGIVFDPALGGPKVVFDLDHPAMKFTWDGVSYVVFDGLFFPNLVPDHPAFANCRNLNP